uniref:AMP-binding enzyme n=1 Tax=uncultured Cellulomonas sp. TaxID=189682 RepID=UPI0028ED07B3
VLVRSVLAGTIPTSMPPGPFRAPAFAAAVASLPADGPRYTSLVPTQLVRLLDDAAATAALTSFDAVLLGGAATPPDVLARARAAGARMVTTYGMTETCGGCVYDGRPLDGVSVALDDDGRILLAGPVLADGYLGRPDLDAQAFVQVDGVRLLRTTDLGAWTGDTLTVLGRADDVLVTGGVKVPPGPVEVVVAAVPGVGEVCVVGVPDPEWGQVLVAVLAVRAGWAAPTLGEVRAAVTDRLGATHAPRHLVLTDSLPVRGPGKIDRRAATLLAVRQLERNLT